MKAHAIGNDVVDLAAPDTRPAAQHPRFDARAFTAAERAAIGSGPAAHRRRWAFWAAKEAAYKALRQEHPALGFVPGRFAVAFAGGRCEGAGSVAVGPLRIPVTVRVGPGWIHAIAHRAGTAPPIARVVRCRPGEDPRAAVRAAALASQPGAAGIERVRRVPRLRTGTGTLPLSLSHHGRFVAFAHFGEDA